MKIQIINDIKRYFSITSRFMKLVSGISKSFIPLQVLNAFFKSLIPFINIIMPKFIIDELTGQKRIELLLIYVAVTLLANFMLSVFKSFLDTKTALLNTEIIAGFDRIVGSKIMNLDYEKIEDPEILTLKNRALFPIYNQNVIQEMINTSVSMIEQIIKIIGLVAVIATLNVLLFAAILLVLLINMIFFKKSQEAEFNFNQELIKDNRELGYYSSLTKDFSLGKDIRLYNMESLLLKKIASYHETSFQRFKKLFAILGRYSGISNINQQIIMILIYTYITYKVFIGDIGIGSFAMYVSGAFMVSGAISVLLNNLISFRQMCLYLESYFQFENIGSRRIEGHQSLLSLLPEVMIEFKNVWFKYPKSKDYILKGISIKISRHEKLSIVGLNGAGKTTFVKLLCRLYDPTDGEILLNGINIKNYDQKDYFNLFSVVFQDFKLFAFSLKENITLQDNDATIDELNAIAIKSGLKAKIDHLENGYATSIYKIFDPKGIELSGGESQKLALARALYKNTPVVILDEPTASLDPYAEYEIYKHFNELAADKTAVFISHRLSSCRFCDRILVFDQGKIVEEGSHQHLVAREEGVYSTLFKTQAQYYAKE